MVFINDQLLENCFEMITNQVSVLTTDDVIRLAINEQSWNFALAGLTELNIERIILEFRTVFLGHLQSKCDEKFRSFDISTGDLSSYNLK